MLSKGIGSRVDRLEPRPRGIERGGLPLERPGARAADTAEFDAHARQALIGIVRPQHQSVLRARRKHAIRLVRAAGYEVVDHDADIGRCPVGPEAVSRS